MTTDFSGFGLAPKLLQSLARMQFTTPTPIQAQVIPLALQGKDILGSAQTGTGKTGAFGIPVIAGLMDQPQACALILAPTRELASQVLDTLIKLNPSPHIQTALLIGGDSIGRQLGQLRRGPRLIVGTPGRVNDHLLRGSLNLETTQFLVLDEADRMLDMGFGPQLDKIRQHLPEQRQTLLFSATMPSNMVKLANKYLNNPERIAVGSTSSPIAKITQELVQTSEGDKYSNLVKQLGNRSGSVIIFVKTKFGADRLADKLNSADFTADAIHGDLRQRQRSQVIQGFRDKEYNILVATDVAARGLDIPHIEHVINYDLPQCPEDYIHRIGRTARAGAEGAAVNLITPADNAKWRAIHRLLNPGEKMADNQNERGFGRGDNGGDAGNFRKKRPFGANRNSGGGNRSSRPAEGGYQPYGQKRRSSGSY